MSDQCLIFARSRKDIAAKGSTLTVTGICDLMAVAARHTLSQIVNIP